MANDKHNDLASASVENGSEASVTAQNGAFVVNPFGKKIQADGDSGALPSNTTFADNTAINVEPIPGLVPVLPPAGIFNTTFHQTGTSQDVTIDGGVVSNYGTLISGFGHSVATATANIGHATVTVDGGGVINGATISDRAEADVGNNGLIDNATVFNGGAAYATAGGVIDGGTVSGGALMASAGGTLLAGDAQHGLSGGIAAAGGTVLASGAGAVASGASIGAGGEGDAVSGGTLVSAVFSSTADVIKFTSPAIGNVSDGGVFSNISVYGAATVNDGAGGLISGATVSAVYGSGVFGQPLINIDGGDLIGGTVIGAYGDAGLLGASAVVNVADQGKASDLDIGAGGTLNVGNGGTAISGIVSGTHGIAGGARNGIVNVTDGGVLSGELVSVYGIVNASSGAHLVSDTANGGTINVGPGASLEGGVVSGIDDPNNKYGFGGGIYSGLINVSGQGASLTDGTAQAYGTIFASDHAVVSGGTALASGALDAGKGGTVLADKGHQVVSAAALAGGTVLASGAGAVVSDAIASADAWGIGGTVIASDGGVVSGAEAVPGGTILADNGGVISGATADGAGNALSGGVLERGTIFVSAGGRAISGVVSGGGLAVASGAGAVISGIDIKNGGTADAAVAGATVGGTVESGASVVVVSGGVVSDATLFGGATLYSPGNGLFPGLDIGQGFGIVSGATYNHIDFAGGQLFGFRNGSMSNVTAYSGADIGAIGSGATISGATASGDASIDALNGGTVFDGTAGSGGLLAIGGVGSLNNLPFPLSGQGSSLLIGGRIENGGLGIVGGNDKITTKKHGTQVSLQGAGVASDLVVDAGGLLDVNGQGTAIGGQVAGTAVVENGGIFSDALFSGASASGYIDVGGVANNNIVSDGGTLTFNGGVGDGNTAQGGGTIDVGGGGSWFIDPNNTNTLAGAGTYYGTVYDTVLSSGGVMDIRQSGVASGVTVDSDATMIVSDGGVANNVTISGGEDTYSGGTNLIDNGSGKAVVDNGGTLNGATLDNGAASKDGRVSSMGGLLRVYSGATVTNVSMGWYGQVEVIGVHYNAGETVSYNSQTNSVYLVSDGKSVWGFGLSGGPYNSSGFEIKDDNGNATIVYHDQCFLKGTRISTPNGEIEVQNLKEGDLVWAIEDGKNVARTIRGTRSQKSNIDKSLPTDLAGWSVCICAGAFGDNLPERDLHVTPEHCFLFEGKFIPVRMLVNGASIYYDTSLADFEYFHFETEPHAIIRAEGVLTESWLNTEERRQAVNLSNGITRLERLPARTWKKDAAAPLDVSPAFAEKLWNNFHVRAIQAGVSETQSEKLSFDDQPNLRLKLADGREITPANRRGNKYFFQIPAGAGAKEISLVSKTFRPSESVGPWIDDRRQLGVLVGKMTVAIGDEFRNIEGHLHAANAQGWDVVENSPCRWTKGNALLPDLGTEEELQFGASLIVEVLAGGPYPEQREAPKMTVLSGASFG